MRRKLKEKEEKEMRWKLKEMEEKEKELMQRAKEQAFAIMDHMRESVEHSVLEPISSGVPVLVYDP